MPFTNQQRVAHAHAALDTYRKLKDDWAQSLEESATDLLTDMLHLLASEEICLRTMIWRIEMLYAQECDE